MVGARTASGKPPPGGFGSLIEAWGPLPVVLNEARVQQPIMPLHLFASRVRAGAYLARMLYLGAMIGFFFFFMTQFLQGVLGCSALPAGIAFFPMTIVNFVVGGHAAPLTLRLVPAT